MTSEDRCRLTYAEGNRIKNETVRPYAIKAAWMMAIGLLAFIVIEVVAHVAAGLPIFENEPIRVLGEAILGGDEGAIDRIGRYSSLSGIGFAAFMMCVVGAGACAAIGDLRAKEAMKKANDEKEAFGKVEEGKE
ncbi:MAG: hypothetical protein J5485_03715 [Candidatus Methanomethylophilaceae archaeon]|nr:hypothetical protein [Candidatus Methanomethylophilaceae archaeon]